MNKGYLVILTGYVGWGLLPLYWALLARVPALEVLLHRMLWSSPVLLLLVLLSPRRRRQVSTALRSPHELKWLVLSSLVISFNWGIYIWAVANHRVVEASMGYFLTPLLNVVAGVLVFRERLARANIAAILFAAAGVVWYMAATAIIPW
ncbi:MAG: EamA family transporter, partial [Gammaproteobacteria bacterium]